MNKQKNNSDSGFSYGKDLSERSDGALEQAAKNSDGTAQISERHDGIAAQAVGQVGGAVKQAKIHGSGVSNCCDESKGRRSRNGMREAIKQDGIACAFIVVFVLGLFAVLLKANGAYPFGEKVISSYDMLAQVAPFLEHFFDVSDGKSSLFYTYAIAGGADVFGTLAYCCISPFTFIFLLFGRGNVYYATSVVLPLKIVCIALSGYFYLRSRFKNISQIMRTALALSYAFCGYLFVSNTYINWVDILIWLPLVAYGFKKIVDGKGCRAFVAGVCLIVYTCFSIACFSLLIIYPIAIFYCVVVVPNERRKKCVLALVRALVLAVGISLPLLVSALFAYLSSGRSQGLFFGLFGEISANPLYYKLSYIFTDGLTLFFTFIYFIKNGVKRPIDRFLIITALITLLPVLCDECCIMLNLGSYNSYALRFGFLNGFYFTFVAGLYADEFKANGKRRILRKKGEIRKPCVQTASQEKIAWSVAVFLIVAAASVGGVFLCRAAENDKLGKYFSSRFAHSLGGLEVTAIVFAIVAIIALLTVILIKYGKIAKRVGAAILLIAVCGQCAFYGENLVFGNLKTTEDFDRIGVITDYIKTLEGGENARVKMYADYLTADMPFTLHTNAYSVFSSVIDDRNFAAQRFFGYDGNGTNTIKSYYGSFFGDCLLGNEYYITKSSSEERNYVRVYSDCLDGDDTGDYYLYKNVYAFPHAFVTPGPKGDFSSAQTLYEQYDSLLKTLGGDSFAVQNVSLKSSSIVQVEDGGYRVSFSRTGDSLYGYYFFVLDQSLADGTEYVLGASSTRATVEENRSVSCQRGGGKYSSVTFYFKGAKTDKVAVEDGLKLYRLSDSTVQELSSVVRENAAEFELSANRIKAKAHASTDGEYLFLNYVALPGHTAFVNGKRVEISSDYLGFMLVPLEKGESEVVVKYESPYIKYAVFGLIGGLLMVFAVIFITKKRDLSQGKTGTVLLVSAYALCGCCLAVFFVFPTGVSLYKAVAFIVKKIILLF